MNRFEPRPPSPTKKPFSWSYSRLKNFETCPYRHQQIDIDKTVSEPESEYLVEGNAVHEALANAIGKNISLPEVYAKYQPWVDRLTSRGNDVIYVEQQLAITEDKQPCEWFARGLKPAWYRAKVDYLKIVDVAPDFSVALAVDYKTGKRTEEPVQLALAAACIFAHYPQIKKIRTEFVWLKEGTTLDDTSREDFTPDDMKDLWVALAPRIEALKRAWETGEYPAVPNRLCRKWCPVEHCTHHGK